MFRSARRNAPPRASRACVKLAAEPLESRDVPALWYLELLAPDVGYEGDTDADITGTLQLSGVSIEAATATEAVSLALQGTIHVEHAGEAIDYAFSPSAIGQGLPFLLDEGTDAVGIQFEDLAGLPSLNPDWDYNDRAWVVGYSLTAPAGGSADDYPIPTGPSLLYHGFFEYVTPIAETAVVEVTVTADKPGFEGLYTWEYEVANQTFGAYSGPGYGIGVFNLGLMVDPTIISNEYNTAGWDHYIDTTPNEPRNVWWSSGEMGPQILPGASALFRFTTPPRIIDDITGILGDAGYAYTAGGGVKGPGEEGAKIEIIDKNNKVLDTLRVAKWKDAFTNSSPPGVKKNFIDLDPDRFFVRVTDKAANTKPAEREKIRLYVKSDSDERVPFDVIETGINTGVFVTKSLMLMSNVKDDVFKVDDVTDNATNDRSFKVKLTDKVTAEYLPAGGNLLKAVATVPIKKQVKVHLIILKVETTLPPEPATGWTSHISVEQAEEAMKKTNEFYAQVGIKLIPAVGDKFGTIVTPPLPVKNSDGIDENTSIANMTVEEKNLLGDTQAARDLRTAALDDIELYAVLRLGAQGANPGEAFPASLVPDSKYADSAIVGEKSFLFPNYVIAHELAHVLLNGSGHIVNQTRVMHGKVAGQNGGSFVPGDEVNTPKRFTQAEEDLMLTARPNLIPE